MTNHPLKNRVLLRGIIDEIVCDFPFFLPLHLAVDSIKAQHTISSGSIFKKEKRFDF